MAVAPKLELYARSVSDREEVAAFLRTDRHYSAYAMGDLDGPHRARCRWGLAYDDLGRPIALAMHQDGVIPEPLFVMGDPAGVVELLSSVIRPRDAYLLGTEPLHAAVAGVYQVDRPVTLYRMTLDRGGFVPFEGGAERLATRDIDDLNRLYQLGFREAFSAGAIEDGIYYGVRVGGRLVSAAGTHVINTREGIGVVGNVMTQLEYRGHDFAKIATSAVTAELLTRVDLVALNVHTDNAPAVAAYQRLGFHPHCVLTQGMARRRAGGWGIMRPIREALRLTWPRETR
jgi:hypothetical protein